MNYLTNSLGRLITIKSLGLVTLMITWQQRVQQRHHLVDLDDRVLQDMGMTRADARREARKPFWRL